MEVMRWVADVEAWVEKSFPGVEEDDGATVEVSALKSRVKAGVGGVSGPVLVLGGGGPVEEMSGGSASVGEICRSVEAHVEL